MTGYEATRALDRTMRRSVAPVLVLLLPALLAAQPRADRAVSEVTRGQRAVALARLDAAIHYFDPVAAAVATPWDSLFAAHAQGVLNAASRSEYRAQISAMLGGRGDALTALEPEGQPARWRLRMEQGVGIVAPESGGATTKPLVAPAMPLLLDLRGGARLGGARLGEQELRALIGDAPVPEQHALFYHGLPPATMQTSGGYSISWRVARSSSAGSDTVRARRRIVILADRATVLPTSLLEGIADGRIRLASTDTPFVVIDGATHIVDMGDGTRAHVRLSKSARFGVAVAADTIIAAADARRVGIAMAQALARREASTFAPRDSASLRPVMPGLGTVRVPLNQRPEFTAPFPAVGYRLLAGLRAWSTFELFSPYAHRLTQPWSGVLTTTLPALERASNDFEFGAAVATIVKHTNDNHSSFVSTGISRVLGGGMPAPLSAQFLDNRLVVTRPAPSIRDTTSLRRGDEILRIDGVSVDSLVAVRAPLFAASTPQGLQYTLEQRVLGGAAGSRVTLALRDPAGAERTLVLQRARTFDRNDVARRGGGVIRMLRDSIGYVDMERLPPTLVDSVFKALGTAKAIIFDMRGYPQGTAFTIGPRIARPDTAPVPVAQFDRPERPSPDSSTFTVFPFKQMLPRTSARKYAGRTALLIDEHAISQSEHSALIMRALAGTIFVGSPTVGANGDVTDVGLPGGLRFFMTGQSVRWPDGSVLQGKGVIPDIAVRPTVRGLRDGIDEVLTAAFTHLGGTGAIPFEENAALEALPTVPLRVLAAEPAARGWTSANLPTYRVGIDTTIDGPVQFAARGSLHITFRGGGDPGVSIVNQVLNAEPWRGKRVTLTGWLRARDVPSTGLQGIGLWLRIDCEDGEMILDNMQQRVVRGTTAWQRVAITLDVPANAAGLTLGALFWGAGEGWVDDVSLAEAAPSAPVTAQRTGARIPATSLAAVLSQYARAPRELTNPTFLVDGGR